MPMTEDLSVFFNLEEHGTRCVLDNVEVVGIFDNGASAQLSGGIVATDPTLMLPTASCRPRTREGSTVRVVEGPSAGVLFTVMPGGRFDDGTGVTALRLQRDVRAAA